MRSHRVHGLGTALILGMDHWEYDEYPDFLAKHNHNFIRPRGNN